ncbi:hypothetical protein [Cytobacillus firmus]|uniref:hypothetical protein n=1 Tax=Cytobacillus firmus TaxID=1399 RepID=UPI0021631EC2|nr:hypothetical protein [Cytobacillus firmus]MCS0671816.1 hypothetical protein [Cytobacillus firmus]
MELMIKKAMMNDAVLLTKIMKAAFDQEAQKWLANDEQKTADFNIQPPGYDSLEMTERIINDEKDEGQSKMVVSRDE